MHPTSNGTPLITLAAGAVPLLPTVAGLSEEQAAEAVEELVRHRLLGETGGGFDLVHDRIRQIVYDDALAPRRAMLHRRVAEAVEAVYHDDLDPHVTVLALHYRLAGAWNEAATYLERAGNASAAHSGHSDAASSFEHALLALGRLPETPATRTQACDLQFRLGYSLAMTGRFEQALGRYEAAATLARALGGGRHLWLAEAGRASALTSLGRYTEGRVIADETLAATETDGDVRGRFWILMQLARIQHALGDHRAGLQHVHRASECLRSSPSIESVGPDFPPDLACRAWLMVTLSMTGDFAAARPHVEELQLVHGDQATAAVHARLIAGTSLGVFYLAQSDMARALPVLESTVDLSRQAGITTMLPRLFSSLGAAYVLSGRAHEAIRLIEEIVERNRAASFLYLFDEIRCGLAEAYLAAGRVADAGRLLTAALEGARARCAGGAEASILRALGELAGRQRVPDLDAAAAHYTGAIALADQLGMRPLAARARL